MQKNKAGLKTLIFALIFALVAGAFGIYLMNCYEESMLRVYATQQDGYVQLVLDQINLNSDLSDDEIINDILGTLDMGEVSYWTMSKDSTMVYVKNVTETNMYKGVESDSVYMTESAQEFVSNLQVDRVTHLIIEMNDGDRYVASGVAFEYNDVEYRICLLTDDTVILENNDFLSVKVAMYVFWILMLCGVVLMAMINRVTSQKQSNRIQELSRRLEREVKTVEILERNQKLREAYDPRWNVYQDVVLPRFTSRLKKKGLSVATFVRLSFENESQRSAFLEKSPMLLDHKVLRFYHGNSQLILLFATYSKEEAESQLQSFPEDIYQIEKVVMTTSSEDIYDAEKEVLEEVDSDGKEKASDGKNTGEDTK